MVPGSLPAQYDMQTPMGNKKHAFCMRAGRSKWRRHGAQKSPGRVRHADPNGKPKVSVMHQSKWRRHGVRKSPGRYDMQTSMRVQSKRFARKSIQNRDAMVPGNLPAGCTMQTSMGDPN